MINLFQQGKFKLHSEQESDWKIECDALTPADWETLAKLIDKRCRFSLVYGVPSGGALLARALFKYQTEDSRFPILLVDDVLTTGKSMQQGRLALGNNEVIGCVVFARCTPPDWVHALFQYNA